MQKRKANRAFFPTQSSVSGGIFGQGGGDDRFDMPGFQRQNTGIQAFEGAAGGKSTNAGQVRDGHFRGGTKGGASRQRTNAFSADGADDDDFLDRLSQAEQRDAEEAEMLAQLQQAASDLEMVRAAAAQIAAEQGLGPEEQYALQQQMQRNLQQQAALAEAEVSAQFVPRAMAPGAHGHGSSGLDSRRSAGGFRVTTKAHPSASSIPGGIFG